MEHKKIADNKYIFRLEGGEDIVSEIERFCIDKKISGAEINGIGALRELEIKHYSVEKQEYSHQEYDNELEICSLYGLVTKVGLHAHIVVADTTMATFGGHLGKGIVGATCEGTITVFQDSLHRKHDERTGLKILDLTL